jgi:tRNA-dihydrouridine synthase 1
MDELQLLHDIVSTLSRNIKVPITCKTRIYRDFHRCIQLYDTLIDAGAKLLTIHGRTINEKGTNIAHADWDMLKRIRLHYAHTHPHIPIIANGGIESYDDIERCLAVTGADGVMVSEAILENPSFFSNPHQLNYRARTPLQLAGMSLHL